MHLDGLPYALELAATKLRVLSPEQLLQRLDDRFKLLRGGSQTGAGRHASLQTMLDWSWELLTASEQALLRRLAVFVGGWSLTAAERVCEDEVVDDVLTVLHRLIDQSLVEVTEPVDGELRYRFLETVRAYALTQLRAAGEEEAMRERQLQWCVELAEAAEAGLKGREQIHWLNQLQLEHDNLRAALEWGKEREEGVRIAAGIHRFWYIRGFFAEGRSWLEKLLTVPCPAVLRIKILNAAGIIAWAQGDVTAARDYFSQCLALPELSADRAAYARARNNLAIVECQLKDFASSERHYLASLEVYCELGDYKRVSILKSNLANLRTQQGDARGALQLLEEALAFQAQSDDLEAAAFTLQNLGEAHLALHELEPASARLREALRIRADLGNTRGVAISLSTFGILAERQGRFQQAARLFGAVEALDIGLEPHGDLIGAEYFESVERVRAALGEAAIAEWEVGRAAAAKEKKVDFSSLIC